MELTDNGFYKTPRIIKGLDFLPFARDVLDCGNELYVKFRVNCDADRILSFTRVFDLDQEYLLYNTCDTTRRKLRI